MKASSQLSWMTAACCVADAELMAVLVRVLWPKMRKRSGRLGGKGAPGSARSAILNFLAAAAPQDLAALLLLSMQPLAECFHADAAGASAEAVPVNQR